MNWAHIHLLLNHIPVIGIILGALLFLLAILRKSDELKRVTMGIFVFMAVIALPVYFTGEPAEALVKQLPGVSKAIIHQHENAALLSLVAAVVTGVVSLAGLIIFRRAEKLPDWIATSTLVLSLVASGLMGWTANLGGQIRHTEIRDDFTAPAETQTGVNQGGAEVRWKTTTRMCQCQLFRDPQPACRGRTGISFGISRRFDAQTARSSCDEASLHFI